MVTSFYPGNLVRNLALLQVNHVCWPDKSRLRILREARDFQHSRRHAGFGRRKERVEARVRIDLQLADKACEVLLRISAVPTR